MRENASNDFIESPSSSRSISYSSSRFFSGHLATSVAKTTKAAAVQVVDALYPFRLLIISIICAWVYTIIPNINFWVYCFIRQQWWGLFAITSFVEIQELCLPDVPDEIYLISFLGFFLEPIIGTLAYYAGEYSNTGVKMLAVTASVIWVNLIYGIHTFYAPNPDRRQNDKIHEILASFSYNDTKSLNMNNQSESSVVGTSDSLHTSQYLLEQQLQHCCYDTYSASITTKTIDLEENEIDEEFVDEERNRKTMGDLLEAMQRDNNHYQPKRMNNQQQTNHRQALFNATPAATINTTTTRLSMKSSGRIFWKILQQQQAIEEQLTAQTFALSTLNQETVINPLSTSSSSTISIENIAYNSSKQITSVPLSIPSQSLPQSVQQQISSTMNRTELPRSLALSKPSQEINNHPKFINPNPKDNNDTSQSTLPSQSDLPQEPGTKKDLTSKEKTFANKLGDPPRFSWDLFDIVFSISYFLPRYYYQRICKTSIRGYIYSDRRIQWIFAAIFNILFVFFLFFLVDFTNTFRGKSSGRPGRFEIEYFFFFVLGSSLIRTALKRTGLALDRRKMGSVSMFFVAEYMGLLFYYTFYRVLFESINSWQLFFAFQVIHLVSEWIMYPLRGSPALMQCLTSIDLSFCLPSYMINLLPSLMPQGTNYEDWINFIALDFGVRVVVMITSSFGILILLVTIDYVPWIDNDLRQQTSLQIGRNAGYLMIAVSLEAINAFLMNELFFKSLKINVVEKVKNCFSNIRFAVLVVFIGTQLFLNPVYAFTTKNSY
jgi:hypothetical protein